MSIEGLLTQLEPLLVAISRLDLANPAAADELAREFPLDSPSLVGVRGLLRAGFEARWLGDRENEGIFFSRVKKARGPAELGIDFVHMQKPGPGHTHPNGEVDLCFAVSGTPRFDGRAEGFTVYPPGSWHVPSVTGGAMDILYFLPGGAITFGPKPGG